MATGGTYSRREGDRFLIWQVDRLITLSAGLPVKQVPVAAIRELDSEMWFGGPRRVKPTCREVADHARRIVAVDPEFPIILSANGSVMDGMHRVARAWMEARREIKAVQFAVDPEPDEVRPA